jgi:hypothetical protein
MLFIAVMTSPAVASRAVAGRRDDAEECGHDLPVPGVVGQPGMLRRGQTGHGIPRAGVVPRLLGRRAAGFDGPMGLLR